MSAAHNKCSQGDVIVRDQCVSQISLWAVGWLSIEINLYGRRHINNYKEAVKLKHDVQKHTWNSDCDTTFIQTTCENLTYLNYAYNYKLTLRVCPI